MVKREDSVLRYDITESRKGNLEMAITTRDENLKAFKDMLLSTKRGGVENVLEGLEKLGFFKAPASSKHHLAEEGGLVEHSLNVYDQACAIRHAEIQLHPELAERLPDDSLIIVSLLHDVCKAEIYKSELKHRKNADGRWEDYTGFTPDYSAMPLGHGEKSVIRLLRMGLELTNDEILAIRWHMANWDLADSFEAKGNFNAACEKCPLLSILIAADGLATRITEGETPAAQP